MPHDCGMPCGKRVSLECKARCQRDAGRADGDYQRTGAYGPANWRAVHDGGMMGVWTTKEVPLLCRPGEPVSNRGERSFARQRHVSAGGALEPGDRRLDGKLGNPRDCHKYRCGIILRQVAIIAASSASRLPLCRTGAQIARRRCHWPLAYLTQYESPNSLLQFQKGDIL